MRRLGVIGVGYLLWAEAILLLALPAQAQFSSDFQTNTINVVSNWVGNGTYIVGSNTFADVLQIVSSGTFSDSAAYIGYSGSGSNNVALVTGSGAVWTNKSELTVGRDGANNELIISDGGRVFAVNSYLGGNPTSGNDSSNNYVLVTGNGSLLRNIGSLTVGWGGSANSLVVSNQGKVINLSGGRLGNLASSWNNSALVAGTGSVWSNAGTVFVGRFGSSNSLVVKDGGFVFGGSGEGASAYVGYEGSNNCVLVAGAGSVWNNSADVYVGYMTNSTGNKIVVDGGSLTGSMQIGYSGMGNSLVISNGGRIWGGISAVGYGATSSNNSAVVTGVGSVWSNVQMSVGVSGVGNSLMITNGGKVVTIYPLPSGFIGRNADSSNNIVSVSGTGSLWITFNLRIGGRSNGLTIRDGGQVSVNSATAIGDSFGQPNVSSNTALVADSGSVWSNGASMVVGYDVAADSQLVISNGGQVVSSDGIIGQYFASNNTVVVTGPNSLWRNTGTISIGAFSSGNSLIISNGGNVICNLSPSGCGYLDGTNNSAQVVDGGIWRCGGALRIGSAEVGHTGANNSLTVTDGSVLASNLFVSCNNFIQLDSGSIVVTNASTNAVFEVRGQFILNGGLLQSDTLVMTNGCGSFVWNGGIVQVGSLLLDANLDADGDGIPNGYEQSHDLDPLDATDADIDDDGDGLSNSQEFKAGTDPTDSASALRITGIATEGDDLRITWMMGSGRTNALQAAAGDSSTYTNSFTDLFTVTNTVGSVTNYLDVGAGTNATGRFYRVRLVP